MLNLHKKTAVILLSDGSPDKIESIQPFLFNFFNDAAITHLFQPLRFFWAKFKSYQKTAAVRESFSKIAVKSTLRDAIVTQAYALEKELSFIGDFKVIISTKYAKPSSKDAYKELAKYDPDQLILLPLYPQFSAINAGLAIEEFLDKIRYYRGADAKRMVIKFTNSYPQANSFITAHSLLIEKTIISHLSNIEKLSFLFVAPGIPKKLINQGDPYLSQIAMTAEAIIKSLAELLDIAPNKLDHYICFQPKMTVMELMQPTLEQKIKKTILAEKIPVIIPIATTCDSIETKLDLDVKYRNIAETFGLTDYLLVPSLNYDGNFIRALVEICQEIDASDRFVLSLAVN